MGSGRPIPPFIIPTTAPTTCRSRGGFGNQIKLAYHFSFQHEITVNKNNNITSGWVSINSARPALLPIHPFFSTTSQNIPSLSAPKLQIMHVDVVAAVRILINS
jgi:hypothetical protein